MKQEMKYMATAFDARRPRHRKQSAFTLIEVLLAISITLGMFMIVLYFYHQASNTRNAVLTEVEKVTAARMILGQITTELRSAVADPKGGAGIRGTSTSIRIATLGLPSAVLNLSSSNNPSTIFQTGLKFVSYSTVGNTETAEDFISTNAPMEQPSSPIGDLVPTDILPSSMTNSTSQETQPGGIQRSEEPILLSSFLSQETAANAGTNNVQAAVPVATTLLTEHFRFLNFRYFDGANFQNSWNWNNLPLAVEITLGNELVQGSDSQGQTELPPDFFRRLVYLPNGESASTTNRLDSLFIDELGL